MQEKVIKGKKCAGSHKNLCKSSNYGTCVFKNSLKIVALSTLSIWYNTTSNWPIHYIICISKVKYLDVWQPLHGKYLAPSIKSVACLIKA